MIEVGDVVKFKIGRALEQWYGKTFLVTEVLGFGDHIVLGMDFPKNQVFQAKQLVRVNESR